MLTYYCVSPRYVLVGRPKLICKADGGWDGRTPKCRLKDRKNPLDRLLELGGRSVPAKDKEMSDSRSEEGLSVVPLGGAGVRKPTRHRERPFQSQPAVPNRRPAIGRPSFAPTLVEDEDNQIYNKRQNLPRKPPTNLDNIDNNILLFPGGGGRRGDNNGGGRIRYPMDNEIPDSANVQASPGQGADEPQPVRNAGPGTNNRQQQQLNLGKAKYGLKY